MGEAQVCPQASPLAATPAQLRECGLACPDQQRFPFEVKAPTLAPFKRLMDSVCRFAFPSVHIALGALRQERERAQADAAAAAAAAAAAPPRDPAQYGPPPAQPLDWEGDPDFYDAETFYTEFAGETEGITFGCANEPSLAAAAGAALAAGFGGSSGGAAPARPATAPAAAAAAAPRAVARLARVSAGLDSSEHSHATVLWPAGSLGAAVAAAAAAASAAGGGARLGAFSGASQPEDEGGEWVDVVDEVEEQGDEQVSPGPNARGSDQAGASPRAGGSPLPHAEQQQQQQQQQQPGATGAPRPARRRRLEAGASPIEAPAPEAPTPEAPAPAPAARLAAADVAAAAVASAAERRRREDARTEAVATRPALLQLQRALVDDFVLYDDSSAARLHLVGQVVAVERGDAGAAARLLAPANADLFAYISTGVRQAQRPCSALPGFSRAAAGITSAAVVPAAAGGGPHQHSFAPEALAAAQQGAVVVRQASPPATELELMLRLLRASGGGASGGSSRLGNGGGGLAVAARVNAQASPLSAGAGGQAQAATPVRRSPRLNGAAAAEAGPGLPGVPTTASPSQPAAEAPTSQPRSRPAPLRLSRLLDGGGGGGVAMPVPLFSSGGEAHESPAAAVAGVGAPPAGDTLQLPRLLPQMPLPTEQQLSAQVLAAPLAQGAGQPSVAGGGGGGGPPPLAAARVAPLPSLGAAPGGGGAAGAMAFGSILAAISGGAGGAAPPGAVAAVAGAVGARAPGAPALLAGGLLSEGGVCGEWGDCEAPEFEASLRRITCHGLMELCAALAQPPAPPHMHLGEGGAPSGSGGGAAAALPGGGHVPSPVAAPPAVDGAAEEERTPRVGGGGCLSGGGTPGTAPRTGALTGVKRRLSGA